MAACQEWRRAQTRRPTIADIRGLALASLPARAARTMSAPDDDAIGAQLGRLRAQGFTVSDLAEYRGADAEKRDRFERASLARAAHVIEPRDELASDASARPWRHVGFGAPPRETRASEPGEIISSNDSWSDTCDIPE